MMWSAVVVLQTTRSSSLAATPADARASRAAGTASSSSVSVVQSLRLRMPVRALIHSSDVSRNPDSSPFVTDRAGNAEPVPRMRNDTYASLACA